MNRGDYYTEDGNLVKIDNREPCLGCDKKMEFDEPTENCELCGTRVCSDCVQPHIEATAGTKLNLCLNCRQESDFLIKATHAFWAYGRLIKTITRSLELLRKAKEKFCDPDPVEHADGRNLLGQAIGTLDIEEIKPPQEAEK